MRLIGLCLFALLANAPGMAQTPEKGMLLVATEEMRDPRFSETVLLMLHYGPEGAIAIAINRPTWVEPAAAFPEMGYLEDYRGHIYFGGPVSRANILVLVRNPMTELLNSEPVVDDVYVSADPEFLREVIADANDDGALRLYAGHANWEAGQLDRELATGGWRLVAGSGDLIFTATPLDLWREVLQPEAEMVVRMPDAAEIAAALQ